MFSLHSNDYSFCLGLQCGTWDGNISETFRFRDGSSGYSRQAEGCLLTKWYLRTPSGQDEINFAACFVFRQWLSVSMDGSYVKGKRSKCDIAPACHCVAGVAACTWNQDRKAWILPWIFSYSNGKHKQGEENRSSEEREREGGVFFAYSPALPISMVTEDVSLCCFLLSNVISSDACDFCSFTRITKENWWHHLYIYILTDLGRAKEASIWGQMRWRSPSTHGSQNGL